MTYGMIWNQARAYQKMHKKIYRQTDREEDGKLFYFAQGRFSFTRNMVYDSIKIDALGRSTLALPARPLRFRNNCGDESIVAVL